MLASYVLSEIIAKSSRSFREGAFIKDYVVKAADQLCPMKTKLYEGTCPTANTAASCVDKLSTNTKQ